MVWSRECHIFMRRRTLMANALTDQSNPSKPAQSTSGLNNIRLIYSLPNFVPLLLVKKYISSNISVIRTRIIEQLATVDESGRSQLHLPEIITVKYLFIIVTVHICFQLESQI